MLKTINSFKVLKVINNTRKKFLCVEHKIESALPSDSPKSGKQTKTDSTGGSCLMKTEEND